MVSQNTNFKFVITVIIFFGAVFRICKKIRRVPRFLVVYDLSSILAQSNLYLRCPQFPCPSIYWGLFSSSKYPNVKLFLKTWKNIKKHCTFFTFFETSIYVFPNHANTRFMCKVMLFVILFTVPLCIQCYFAFPREAR